MILFNPVDLSGQSLFARGEMDDLLTVALRLILWHVFS